MNKDNFNYVIGTPHADGSIGTYRVSGMEIFHGNMDTAQYVLNAVHKQEYNNNWYIYKLVKID